MNQIDLNLAVIGNCATAALADRRGRIVWWCYPQLDGDPVFSYLLKGGADQGFTDIQLEGMTRTEARYLRNSAILETILEDDRGNLVRITDFCPRYEFHDRFYRPSLIMRRIEPLNGLPLIRVRMRPTFGYGEESPPAQRGSNHLLYRGDTAIRVTTDVPLSYIVEESAFALDAPMHLIIGPDERIDGPVETIFREQLNRTERYWREWVRGLSVPFEWQEAVIRAAITLKLCSLEETGGIVAALTTSVPEASGSQRNWDYRYSWLRDTYFTVHALNRLGATRTMEGYLRYITTVIATNKKKDIPPLFALTPGRSLPEHFAQHLPGYRNMGPVRIGNEATNQIQNDGYGSVVLALAQFYFDERLPVPGDGMLYDMMEQLAARAAEVALTPDAGLWEFRTRAEIHTHSAAMCWAACDRVARIAARLGKSDRAQHWQGEARRIRQAILAGAWNEELQSFTSSFGGDALDACLLQLHELGLVAADDPRFLGTVAAIERDLLFNGHLKRYKVPDDFGEPEVAFVICRFWYIDALTAIGRKDEARALFEDMLRHRNSFGILSEDIAPQTGEMWGNFPQTYSHVGLIISAMRLSKSWEEAFWRPSVLV
ncbi:MAG TPA: glycoside hydrolase family 15 protein [Dongiaceae bacterium]|jgi:GH15 family glucan-1,4-alpha-glucosidase|nr:glycoside hydrolase family 15 protein [Dongiaceae bacterium]